VPGREAVARPPDAAAAARERCEGRQRGVTHVVLQLSQLADV
jgi:hypothetical protein